LRGITFVRTEGEEGWGGNPIGFTETKQRDLKGLKGEWAR